jgi:hypothetical protein
VRTLGDKQRQAGVDLRLLRASPRPLPHTAEPLLVADLDYLATIQMDDPAEEQRLAGDLVLAAMGRWDLEVVAGADALSACAALGLPPAPGVIFRLPLVREPEHRLPPRVREPLVVHAETLGVIAGQVLGPDDIPIAGATVSAVGLERFARTDVKGRFELRSAPASGPVRLRAEARGVEAEGVATPGEPITLRLPLEV